LGKDITHCYNSPRSLVSADFDVFELIAQTHGKAPLVIFTDNDSVLREYVGTVSAATGALPNSDEQDGWPRFVVPVTLTYDIYDQYVRSRGLSVNQLYYALTRTRDIERVGGGRTDMELFEDFVTSRMEAGYPALEEGKPYYFHRVRNTKKLVFSWPTADSYTYQTLSQAYTGTRAQHIKEI
jgi:hypothetical protein